MAIAISIENLSTFILQYIVATLVAGLIFYSLWSRRFSIKPDFIVPRPSSRIIEQFELIGQNFYCSLESAVHEVTESFALLMPGTVRAGIPSSGLRTEYRKGMPVTQSAEYLSRSRKGFKAPSVRVRFPELFYRKNIYDAFVSFFSISVWAGVLLLLTPYQKIFVFIPHFANNNVNLAIVIIFAITVFESGIATLFMHIGTARKRVAAVSLGVMAVLTAALYTPSFTWFRNFTNYGEFLIYIILGVLILSITILISLLREKNTLYRLSLYSSFVSYGFFILVTMYNIIASIYATV